MGVQKAISKNIRHLLLKGIRHVLSQKGFTQTESIDYKETFSPILMNDSFRIIMTVMAHFDLELHQMNIKTVFINGDIRKKSIWCNQTILKPKICNIWFTNQRNSFMV